MSKWYHHYPADIDGYNAGRDESPIQGVLFRKFLNICWPFTDYITLSEHMAEDKPENEFTCVLKEGLHEWFAGYMVTDEWFGYGRGSSEMRIYRYHATRETKEKILSSYLDIFLRLPAPGLTRKIPDFFRIYVCFSNGRLFLGTISHEQDAFLYSLNDSMLTEILPMGRWEMKNWSTGQTDIHKYNWVK